MACTDLLAADRRHKETPVDPNVEAPIPEPEAVDIAKRWDDRHNFVLPDNQLLIPNQQGKMWRDFHADPHALSVWLGNKLRPRSFLDLPSGNQLAVVPGQTVRAVEVIADDVVRSFDLFARIRAFFMTAAFVSITDPD